MAINPHPFHFNAEELSENANRGLWNQHLDETSYLFGVDCTYMHMTHTLPDEIFGEYLGESITNGISIRLLIEQIEEDFQNEDTAMMGKFGFNLNMTECTINASMSYFDDHNITPQVEDLILYKKVNKVFQILKVTKQERFKIRLDCELFNYSNQKIDESTVPDQEVKDLEFINDTEVEKIDDPVEEQIISNGNLTGTRSHQLYD